MKKLLTILGACAMTASSAGSVIACDDGLHHDVTLASVVSSKFVSDTRIDVLMNKSMTEREVISADFKVFSGSSDPSKAEYLINTVFIDVSNADLVHLTIEEGHSAEHLQLSYKGGDKVAIDAFPKQATVQSASFEEDTKIDLKMSQPVTVENVKLEDFKITAEGVSLKTDDDYGVITVKIDGHNDSLVCLTIPAGHSTQTNLQVSYKNQSKVSISSISAPAAAVSAKFKNDTKINVSMDKPVKKDGFTLDDFAINGGDGAIKIVAADLDTNDHTLVVLTVSPGYSLLDNMQLKYKSADVWLSIFPAPLNVISAIFDDDNIINAVMNRVPSEIKATDFIVLKNDDEPSGIAINSVKIDGNNPKLVHLNVDSGHEKETDLKLAYNTLEISDGAVDIAPIPDPIVKSASFVDELKIDVTMDRKIKNSDFTKSDFIITTATNDAIAVTNAVLDGKNNKLVHLTIDKAGHFADTNLQLIYKNSKNTIIIVPEVAPIVKFAKFNSDTTILVYMNRQVLATEFSKADFLISDPASGATYKAKSADFEKNETTVICITIDKGHSAEINLLISFKGADAIALIPNTKPEVMTASLTGENEISLVMNVAVYGPDLDVKNFSISHYSAGGGHHVTVSSVKLSEKNSKIIVITIFPDGFSWKDVNASLIYEDNGKVIYIDKTNG